MALRAQEIQILLVKCMDPESIGAELGRYAVIIDSVAAVEVRSCTPDHRPRPDSS